MTSFATTAPLPTGDPTSEIHVFDDASIDAYCQKRRIAFQNDTAAIDLAKEDLLRRQQQIVLQGLLKLTKDVKKMTVGEFDENYGCDIIEMIKKMMLDGDIIGSNGKKRARQLPRGGSSSSGGPGVTKEAELSLKTPAPRFGMGVPATRTARKGEKIIAYSVNGSPVDQFDRGELVVTAKKRRPNQGSVALPVTIGIGAGNGECIDLADPNQRKKLCDDEKKLAIEQILAMQEQMKNLMADW